MPKKLRVLLVGPLPPPIGGMASYVQGYLHSDITRVCDVHVLRSDLVGKYRFRGLVRKLLNVVNAAALHAALVWQILGRRPGIVHVQANSFAGFFEKASLLLLARLTGRKAILHIHGGMFREFYSGSSPLGRWAIRRCLAVSHRIIAPTPRMRETFEFIGVAEHKIVQLPNGVFVPDCQQAKSSAHGEMTVLYVGRIDLNKGLSELVQSARMILGDNPYVRFRILGLPSPDSETLRRQIEQAGLADRIELAGPISDNEKSAAFCDADVYVLPSYVEDLPYSLLEAMSHGLPCVATAVGGVGSLIADGVNGVLIEPRNVDALTAAIGRLLAESDLRNSLGAAARETISSRYSWSSLAPRIMALYQELAASR